MKYLIKVYNDCNVEIFSDYVYGDNENKAIKNLLEDVTLYVGDKIVIEE